MEKIDPKILNDIFVNNLGTSDGIDKIAQSGTNFVRVRLKEVSFMRKIVPPQYVTQAELQRSIQHEGLVKIVDIEPDSTAMVINFRGDAPTNYIMGERFEIPFFNITSPNYQKIEEELMAYEMPITEIIERNSVLDIQKQEDKAFLSSIDDCIAYEVVAGNQTHISGLYDTDGSIKKKDLVYLFDTLDGNSLRCETLLMDTTTYNKLIIWASNNIGSEAASEITVNGYTYSTLFGRKLVVSSKKDLLANKIYAFTSQDFFGQFLILQDAKFWIEKKKNLVTFASYETIGLGIGNTKSVAKLTLS